LNYFPGNQDEVKNSRVTPDEFSIGTLKMTVTQQQPWHTGW